MRFACLSLLAFLLPSANLRADDAADARAIVARSAKVAGIPTDGKPIAMTWKVTGKSLEGPGTTFTGDVAYVAPDKYRFTLKATSAPLKIEVPRRRPLMRRFANELGEMGGITIEVLVVVNGKKAWQSALGTSQEMTGKQLEKMLAQVYLFHIISLAPLLTEKEFKLSTAGEKEVNGKKTAAVKVERDQKQTITLFFDKDTGLLAKAEVKAKDALQGGKEVLNEVYFDDYKDVGGRKYYTQMRLVEDGKLRLVDTISDQKAPEKLDPKLFEAIK